MSQHTALPDRSTTNRSTVHSPTTYGPTTYRSTAYWADALKAPKHSKLGRDVKDYPSTLLGDLAYCFREAFSRTENHPPPTPQQLAYTAHLVGLFAQEYPRTPLHKRTDSELILINYLVTPRSVWKDAMPLLTATQNIIGDSLLESPKMLAALFRRAWTRGELSSTLYNSQQIALHLGMSESHYAKIGALVSLAAPSRNRYQVSPIEAGGAFALLSLSAELGHDKPRQALKTPGLLSLLHAEGIPGLEVINPLSRPTEYRFVSLYLAELLRAACSLNKIGAPKVFQPNRDESLDITQSWLEGSHFPITNYFRHIDALTDPTLAKTFGTLYNRHGIRNFMRLKLADSDDPWFLARIIAGRAVDITAGSRVIMIAASSGDHNDAYSERAWEFEEVRAAGESQGWQFDYVEVRDSAELAFHILRHQDQGSRVSVLHQLGHGCADSAEFGRLEQDARSQLTRRTLFSDPDQQELCGIASNAVDTWVLHHCSTADNSKGRNRKIANVAEALFTATDRQVNIVGFDGPDAFDSLTHRTNGRNEILFTGKPVWYGVRRFNAVRS